jgi:hypothetical protein
MLLFLLSYYDIGDLDVHISSDFCSSFDTYYYL